MNFTFIFNSILLGVGLAMDAFSVSLANGLNEPKIKKKKQLVMAGIMGTFQGFMPLIGWFCVHTIATYFKSFKKLIPWIAMILLCYIGLKMLLDGIKPVKEESEKVTSLSEIVVQGIATSIDALSVGFTISDYPLIMAIVTCFIIGITTFFISWFGVIIGRKFGIRYSSGASMFGGVILIAIGIHIFMG